MATFKYAIFVVVGLGLVRSHACAQVLFRTVIGSLLDFQNTHRYGARFRVRVRVRGRARARLCIQCTSSRVRVEVRAGVCIRCTSSRVAQGTMSSRLNCCSASKWG